ncbi:MAG: hypothetical protein II932_04580 [Treponema sp.]|nr:hypothetical protein [Treponema sp.]
MKNAAACRFFQHPFLSAVLSLLAALSFSACERSGKVTSLEEKTIFTLGYGNFENQLNIFDLTTVSDVDTSLVMRNGFFYILNGESRKIMEMNNFGDLIVYYYNPEFNPRSSYLDQKSSRETTMKAVEYGFNELSAITVDSSQKLYAVDTLPLDRQEQDEKKQLVLSQIVLRFDGKGNFIDYIGQQGPGGTPFPYIQGIYSNNANELIVVCYLSSSYTVYWFSSSGYLLYQLPIAKDGVPNPLKDEGLDSFSTITAIIPDYTSRTLYLAVDYYKSYVDEAIRLQSGVDYDSSRVYPLSVEDGRYGEPIEVLSASGELTDGFSGEQYSIPFDFLGVTESGWLFFIVSTAKGFEIQMIQGDGQRILRRDLDIDRTKLLYYNFDLSNSGILSALLVKDAQAEVVWWRTDSLIQSVINN